MGASGPNVTPRRSLFFVALDAAHPDRVSHSLGSCPDYETPPKHRRLTSKRRQIMVRLQMALTALALAVVTPGVAFGAPTDPKSSSVAGERGGVAMPQRQSGSLLAAYRIVSVAPYTQEQTHIKRTWTELRGAVVRVEAQPGLTAEWLQLQLDRHVVAMGMRGENMDDCPLAVPGVRATVSRAADGFLITVAASDKSSGQEVLRRAQWLAAQQPR
jgi:hypothetical protein